jgi:hypothetical protein
MVSPQVRYVTYRGVPANRLPSGDRSGCGFTAVVRSGSVPRGSGVRRASRPRGLLGTRGRAGLASTVGPVLVGVILAFAWNMAGSHAPEMPKPGPALAPTVGTAVDQAADQAWASVTPTSTRLPDHRASFPARSRGVPRQSPEARKKATATSTSTTARPAHRRSGRPGTLIVAVPTRGKPALRFVGHADG